MKVVNCMAIAAGLCVASTGAWAAGGASQAPGFWTWQGFGSRSHLTGDWGGARSELEKDGISLGSDYEAEFGQTLEGGFTPGNHGTGVVNQINFSADFDMDKLVGLRGGTFHLLVNSIWGHSNGGNSYAHFTNRLGTFVSPTEIYGTGLITRLTEAAYEQKLFNDQLDVLIGYSPMGDAFGTVPVQFDFVNSSLFANPVAMPFNTGWENYPTGQWGVSAKWNVTSDLYGQIGVYEANPALSSNSGFHMGFDGATGSVSGVEIGYSPTLHVGNAVLPGVYKLGGVYDSSIIHAGLTPTNTRRGTFLGYFQMQQMLVNFDASADRGLIFFAQEVLAENAPENANNPLNVNRSATTAGFVVQGPFSSRPHDFIALGWGRTGVARVYRNEFSAHTGVDPWPIAEDDFELDYGFQAAPWLTLQPYFQYLLKPWALDPNGVAGFGAPGPVRYHNPWFWGVQVNVVL